MIGQGDIGMNERKVLDQKESFLIDCFSQLGVSSESLAAMSNPEKVDSRRLLSILVSQIRGSRFQNDVTVGDIRSMLKTSKVSHRDIPHALKMLGTNLSDDQILEKVKRANGAVAQFEKFLSEMFAGCNENEPFLDCLKGKIE